VDADEHRPLRKRRQLGLGHATEITGWEVKAHDLGTFAAALGRWPYPLAPPGLRGVPRSFRVEAIERGEISE
jgi:hypothetical protein